MSDIDFVVLWVDSTDVAWQEKFTEFKGKGSHGERAVHPARFRDMGIFKYWFRCVEKYAPWVRKVHLVTCGQIPSWINVEHEKLNIVFHDEFIPSEYLPTFNSNTIELNLHRIKDLSNKFVLFNDDTFITSPLREDFYFDNGYPNDFLIIKKQSPKNKDEIIMRSSEFLNVSVLNTHINKKTIIKENRRKYYGLRYKKGLLKNFMNRRASYFEGFYGKHLPQPFLKSTFTEIWQAEEELLKKSSSKRFREPLCLTQYLFRYWQLAHGNFNPKNPEGRGVYFNLSSSNINEAIKTLSNGTAQACFNDTEKLHDFEKVTTTLRNAFEMRLGHKSSFEI
ncbi:Stealth CR1 domain-containing protein [Citrobacter koseri]|uniref:Stealth CR1 domain-containing protein n=1 Tax=Citrobacter koseri TaxID=545 RepID=UPI00192CCA1A|nr:Stealth CR1 domain-containing protein [Citrobacter koseri]MBL4564843.1 Stealth CR1 domain-containing protein [Citrobacter koseri]